ncbi:hypothetical protein [Pedobacter sp. Leaf250]|uniref:hypothetical protein n=1 Tax=Pedobacter sp. Leaf250 TaxID=2876559 RepID=UPI001E298A01|nr:hypothetical protein [Pedobacter sp. Leaf250]
MKNTILLFTIILIGQLAYSQQNKQSIDYQYFRDNTNYYAFELFTIDNKAVNNQLMINFTANVNFKKIDKVYLKSGETELKLKFKVREEVVKSDNPEQKFYPIIFDAKDLIDRKIPCEAEIVFKLNTGLSYILPFNTCNAIKYIAKN